MATNTGTYDISDLLAANFQSVADFGLDTIEQVLQADLDAHNTIIAEMVSDMAEPTTDRQRVYGTSAAGQMTEVDEYGKGPTQKNLPGETVAFPLRLFQYNIGWTAKWMQTKTPREMAEAVLGAETAHMREIQRQFQKAIYLSANYTFTDYLVDKVALAVKRFVNADSAGIPSGPNGETFDGATHTHFDGNATLTAAELLLTVNTVVEHGHGADVRIAINRTDEAAVRLLTGFTAYVDPRNILRVTDAPGKTLDISRLDNRAIGTFGAAEVWVKSWAIANYAYVWDAGAPQKPLVFRQRASTSLQGLNIAAEHEDYPLFARFMEAEFGVAVWNRTAGAVLNFSNASYTDPTIA